MESDSFESLMYAGHIISELSKVKLTKEEFNEIIEDQKEELTEAQKDTVLKEFGFRP